MAQDRPGRTLDRDLSDLPPELRWRTWMRRIEAVLFASAAPVSSEDLARVVGRGASVDLLVGDLAAFGLKSLRDLPDQMEDAGLRDD